MFQNHLVSAIRNLRKQKLYTLINVVGLALGLGACFLIAGFVEHEFSFEDVHFHKDRIFRVATLRSGTSSRMLIANAPAPLAGVMRAQCPEVESVMRLRRARGTHVAFRVDQDVFRVGNMLIADPEILDIFTLPLRAGKPSTALAAPNSVLISERVAQTCFGETNPVGRTVRLEGQFDCQVTGILETIPTTTQIRCDLLVSYATLQAVGVETEDWGSLFTDYVYLLLHDGAHVIDVEARLPAILSQHAAPEVMAGLEFLLQPLRQIYLHSDGANELRPQGDMSQINLAVSIALLILIIAVLNFVNLSTARAGRRAPEVGLRKVLGARCANLAGQFLSESMLVATVALGAGLVLYELGRPYLVLVTGRQMNLAAWYEPTLLASFLAVTVVVGLCAGGYPALMLSRYTPLAGLRGGCAPGAGRSMARCSWVVVQFATAVMLVGLTLTVYRQVDFSINRDTGIARDGIVVMEVAGSDSNLRAAQCRRLKEELLRRGIVTEAAASCVAPGEDNVWLSEFANVEDTEGEEKLLQIVPVDCDYLQFYGLTLVAGRQFSKEFADDNGKTLILTEEAAKRFGLEAPVGASLSDGDDVYTVVGMVSDFTTLPASYRDFPIALQVVPDAHARVAVKLPPGDMTAGIKDLESVWRELLPDLPFNHVTLDDLIARAYQNESKLGVLGVFFASMAMVIACLGILGLAAYAVEQRTKEIGIRKVLGSSMLGVVKLFLTETTLLMVLANVVALPLIWYIGNFWLEKFVHRVGIGPWTLAVAGAAVFLIALATVGSQVVRAARANPVEALKYE